MSALDILHSSERTCKEYLVPTFREGFCTFRQRKLWAQSVLAATQRGKLRLRWVNGHSRNTENLTLSAAWPDARSFVCLELSLDYGTSYDRTELSLPAFCAAARVRFRALDKIASKTRALDAALAILADAASQHVVAPSASQAQFEATQIGTLQI